MSTIKKIGIKGFKSILDQEVELGRLNVFIGTNGAGKSNLLEAIAMLSASIEGGIDYERLARRGARLSSPQIFRSALKDKDRQETFSIETSTDELTYHINIKAVDGFSYQSESLKNHKIPAILCSRDPDTFHFPDNLKNAKFDTTQGAIPIYNLVSGKTSELTKIQNFAIYAPSTPILRGVSSDNSNKAPLGLYGGRLAEALKEIMADKTKQRDLSRFFELLDWFKEVEATEQTNSELISEHVSVGRNIVKYKDEFMNVRFNDLYAYDVSEGALYILFVLVLLSHQDAPDFLALDNVDNALNPGLVRNLMAHIAQIIAEDMNKQVLLTTHNPTTLDAIDLFNEDHRLFVVKRGEDGQTLIERIAPPQGMTKAGWEEKYFGLKLSEVWLSGAIGGLTQGF